METQAQAIERLLTALEKLVEQESLQVTQGDHGAVLRTQQRATPIVERLVELGARVVDPSAHNRVVALLEKRQRSQQLLAVQMARVREELARTRASQNRLASIAPVYVGQARRRLTRRLCAVS
jgi:hypothetical protein